MRHQRRKDVRIPRARRLRRDMTLAEKKLWRYLRQLPLGASHFRRQATIGPFFADFACHELRVVVEVDGGGHGLDDKLASDARRTEYLESCGYRVLRFWNNDVLNNIEAW
jgi:very-short-patch-repair endonuclease